MNRIKSGFEFILSSKRNLIFVSILITVTLILLGTFLHSHKIIKHANADVLNQLPVGSFDSTINDPCGIHGWAADPDSPSQSLAIHIYRDGTPGTWIGQYIANGPRPDVNAKTIFTTGNHGFDGVINFDASSGLFDGQTHQIYVYAIDAQDSNQHTFLGVKPITCPANRLPTGNFDSAINESCTVNGWAADPDNPTTSLAIHIYKDGNPGTFVGAFNTNLARPDVIPYYPQFTGTPGFSYTFPVSSGLYDGQQHQIYLYAIDAQDSNQHTFLGVKPITCPSPTVTFCVSCAAPPQGCTYQGGSCQSCGTLECSNTSPSPTGGGGSDAACTVSLAQGASQQGSCQSGFTCQLGASSACTDSVPGSCSGTCVTTATPAPICPLHNLGDINCDGKITNDDFEAWKADFLWNIVPSHADEPHVTSDLNHDNKVDTDDFNIWRDGFINTSLPH